MGTSCSGGTSGTGGTIVVGTGTSGTHSPPVLVSSRGTVGVSGTRGNDGTGSTSGARGTGGISGTGVIVGTGGTSGARGTGGTCCSWGLYCWYYWVVGAVEGTLYTRGFRGTMCNTHEAH